MGQIRASRDSAALPLHLAVTRPDGSTGLTIFLEVRDGATVNSYLDFFDNTLKTSGWTSKTSTLTELGNGHYTKVLDLSAITNVPTLTEHLVAEYRSSAVTPNFAAQDLVSLPLNVDTGVDEHLTQKRMLSLASGKIAKTSDQYAYMDETGVTTLFVLEDNDPVERTRIS